MSGIGIEFLLPTAVSAITAGATALLGGKKPKLPTPEPVRLMPDTNSPRAEEERRRRVADLRTAEGRQGTNLVTDDTRGNTLLGQ